MRRFVESCVMAGLLAVSAVGHCKEAPASDLQLVVSMQVLPDGSTGDIELDAGLPDWLQTAMRRQAATWRHTPVSFQGKPAAYEVRHRVGLAMENLPEGGVVFRIKKVEPVPPTGWGVPRYPREAFLAGVSARLVYTFRRGPDGYPTDVQRVEASLVPNSPQRLAEKWTKMFEEPTRASFNFPLTRMWVDGQQVDCVFVHPVTFQVERAPLPEQVITRDSLPDACPEQPKLGTDPVGRVI